MRSPSARRIGSPCPGWGAPLPPRTYRRWWLDLPAEDTALARPRAQLEPPRGEYGWQDWSFAWDSISVGRHTLRARATDAAGNVQPDVPPWNRLGYGNNAIEVIYVDRA